MSSNDPQNSGDAENTCVVCFKTVEIYSIGVCDHAVCFECSTRMRVLCRQNECPICRQDLPKVIFTKRVEPFHQLLPRVERNGQLWDRKFGLYFCSPSIQKVYYRLLEHNCQICSEQDSRRWPFKTFQQLKDHMRREHELFFCELCVEHLKIFTFERRCYSRAELAHHKRKGDADNTSHRGHPLCQFCDVRYLDSDELFRHLRKDHLFCHFCDTDGKHFYYSSYTDLRTHFREEHYLCEEGECKNEVFTSAFRTDIDLKAHVAQVHSRHLKGAANKQARTLDIEFTLAPRPRQERIYHRQNYIDRSNDGASGYDSYNTEPGGSSASRKNTFVNPMSTEDFPSLNSSGVSGPAASSVTFTSKISSKPFSQEDFPSLGLPTRTSSVTITGKLNAVRNADSRTSFIGGSSSSRGPNVTITRNAQNPALCLQRNSNNFPALGGESSSGSSNVKVQVIPSQDLQGRKSPNVSIHLNNANGGITTRIRSSEQPATVHVRPKSMVDDFPALGKNMAPNQPQWVTAKPKKQEPKASKVAPAPLLPPSDLAEFPSLSKKGINSKKQQNSNNSDSGWVNLNNVNKSNGSKTKEQSPKTNDKSNQPEPKPTNNNKQDNSKQSKSSNNNGKSSKSSNNNNNNANSNKIQGSMENGNTSTEEKSKNKNNKKKSDNNNTTTTSNVNGTVKKRTELNIDSLHISEENSDFPALGAKKPPPGFNVVKPPPGFAPKKSNSANIVLSQPNTATGLTFTNSSGQSYPINPLANSVYQYHTPNNFQARNRSLFDSFMSVVKSGDVLRDFKNYSDLFRNGTYPAEKFYEHCQTMLGSRFEPLFCELVVLLPNVEKQLELYKVYKSKTNSKSLDVCSMCSQVVLCEELREHFKNHEFDNQYPALGSR